MYWKDDLGYNKKLEYIICHFTLLKDVQILVLLTGKDWLPKPFYCFFSSTPWDLDHNDDEWSNNTFLWRKIYYFCFLSTTKHVPVVGMKMNICSSSTMTCLAIIFQSLMDFWVKMLSTLSLPRRSPLTNKIICHWTGQKSITTCWHL